VNGPFGDGPPTTSDRDDVPEVLPAGSVDGLDVRRAMADAGAAQACGGDGGPTGSVRRGRAGRRRQWTPARMARGVKLSDHEVRNLKAHGVEFPDSGWDLVTNILVQVREGSLTWNPARCSLLQYVCAALQWRGRQLMRRRGRERSLDALLDGRNGDGSGDDAARGYATVEAALALDRGPACPPDVAYDRARLYERFVRAMWKLVLARKDAELTAAFEAWAASGEISEGAVAAATGLPLNRALRAVRVLRKLVDRLPADLRAEIKELLT